MADSNTIGPNEQEFMFKFKNRLDSYLSLLKKNPGHRDFIFEQMLKLEKNMADSQKLGSLTNELLDQPSRVIVLFAIAIAFFTVIIVMFTK